MKRDLVLESERLLIEYLKQLSEINTYMQINKAYRQFSIIAESALHPSDIYSGCITKIGSVSEIVQTMLDFRLHKFCINSKSKGFMYIKEIVDILMSLEGRINFKRHIYPLIAKRHGNTTADSVDHAIRNALKSAYDRSRDPECKIISDMRMFDKCPSNKRFLLDIVYELKHSIHTEVLNF